MMRLRYRRMIFVRKQNDTSVKFMEMCYNFVGSVNISEIE